MESFPGGVVKFVAHSKHSPGGEGGPPANEGRRGGPGLGEQDADSACSDPTRELASDVFRRGPTVSLLKSTSLQGIRAIIAFR